jgi:hypothetical protein
MSEHQIRKYANSVFPFIEVSSLSKEEVKIPKINRIKILLNALLVPVAKACRPLCRRKRAFVDERKLSIFDEKREVIKW